MRVGMIGRNLQSRGFISRKYIPLHCNISQLSYKWLYINSNEFGLFDDIFDEFSVRNFQLLQCYGAPFVANSSFSLVAGA